MTLIERLRDQRAFDENGRNILIAAADEIERLQANADKAYARCDAAGMEVLKIHKRVAELEGAAKFLCAVLRTRTWEDKDMNACGMKAGDSTDVHALRKLEQALAGEREMTEYCKFAKLIRDNKTNYPLEEHQRDCDTCQAEARIAELESRLEVYPVNLKTGERDKSVYLDESCDGIACRDETIKLQDKRIAELEELLGNCRDASEAIGERIAELEAEREHWKEECMSAIEALGKHK